MALSKEIFEITANFLKDLNIAELAYAVHGQ